MAQQWLSASDPYWSQFGNVAARDPESGEFTNPYISTIRGLQAPENWRGVARQLGYQGPFETQVISSDTSEGGGGYVNVPAPEFLQFIQQKQAEGYDFVTKADQINKDRQTIGLRTPTGEVINQTPVKVSGFGDFFKEFVLPAVAAYGAVNFLGPRLEGLTNALSGGGQLSAAELAKIPTGTMGQTDAVRGVVTPAAAATDAAAIEAAAFENALMPSSTGATYPYGGGTSYVNPTVGTVGTAPATTVGAPIITADYTAAANTLSSMGIPVTPENVNALLGVDATSAVATGAKTIGAGANLGADVLDAALAGGAPIGATTGTAPLGGVGVPELTAGAGGGSSATAATNALAPAAGLSAEALDAALAGAGGGAGAGAAGATGGGAALQALGGSLQAGTTPGALGSVIGSAGTGAAIAAGAAPTILDQAINLVTSPAGQAVVGAAGSVAGGVMQANAAEAAANQQAEAARNALQLQREMFEYQKGLLEPYRTAGTAALKRLEGALGLGGTAQAQQALEMDPGYGFRLGEGMKALERMQAARGNMLSGGALKAGQRYAQDYASGEYQNAYNRLANIAGLGQTVGGQLGSAAQQFGTSAGNVMGQEANALAAGRYGRTSAYTDALGGVLGAYENYLNRGQRNQLARDIYGRMLGGGG